MMYTNRYDLDEFRNVDYRVMDYIGAFYKSNSVCLDLGCGSCRKLLPILTRVSQYFVIDNDKNRILAAKNQCSNFNNVEYVVADNTNLPFKPNTFDLVSCFLTKYALEEVCRVLKPGGFFIIETLGADDKKEIRRALGRDKFGWRSSLLEESQPERKERLVRELSDKFDILMIKELYFNSCIRLQYIIELFQMTNEIRELDPRNDYLRLVPLTDSNGNITFCENRLILVAKIKEKQHF